MKLVNIELFPKNYSNNEHKIVISADIPRILTWNPGQSIAF